MISKNAINVDRFDGKVNFAAWKHRFRNMMEIVDGKYERLFDHFETFTRPIIDEDFNNNHANQMTRLSKFRRPCSGT